MKYLLPTCFLVMLALTVKCQTNCELKVEKDSVKVFLCHLKDSRFKAVKSTFVVNSSLSQLAAMVLDVDDYGAWQYKTVSARVIKKISEREIIYYTEVAAPILTSNRDFVIRLTLEQNPHTRELIIEAVSIPTYLPTKEKVVRVPFSKARWTVKPLSHARIQVEYYIEIDLGGAVPPWMVNMVAPQAPYETFKAMREKIGRYKNSKAHFIKD